MKQIRDKVGGLDVHRDSVVACTRVTMPNASIEVTKKRFATTQTGLAELTAFLIDAGVGTVAMEATGIYWRAVYQYFTGEHEVTIGEQLRPLTRVAVGTVNPNTARHRHPLRSGPRVGTSPDCIERPRFVADDECAGAQEGRIRVDRARGLQGKETATARTVPIDLTALSSEIDVPLRVNHLSAPDSLAPVIDPNRNSGGRPDDVEIAPIVPEVEQALCAYRRGRVRLLADVPPPLKRSVR